MVTQAGAEPGSNGGCRGFHPEISQQTSSVYASLATSKIFAGHAEEAIPLQEKAIELNPRSSYLFNRYRQLGFASLLLGGTKMRLPFSNDRSQSTRTTMAVVNGFTASLPQPMRNLGSWRRQSVRSPKRTVFGPTTPFAVTGRTTCRAPFMPSRSGVLQAGLRLVGERDHADEEADFGVPSDAALRNDFAVLTPTAAPGARTIRTTDLAKFLVLARPVVIDTVSYSWGRSMPGAVGLKFAGLGGSLTDCAQDACAARCAS